MIQSQLMQRSSVVEGAYCVDCFLNTGPENKPPTCDVQTFFGKLAKYRLQGPFKGSITVVCASLVNALLYGMGENGIRPDGFVAQGGLGQGFKSPLSRKA